MDQSQKEELIFGLLMTVGMVTIMTSYNIIGMFGFNGNAFMHILTGITPIFITALVVEQLIINHNVQKLHKLIVSPNDPQFKKIVVFSVLMVTGMCLSMTLYATLANVGTGPRFFEHYLTNVARNYPVALISQLFVVGPLARAFHARLFKKSIKTQTVALADGTAA